MSKKYKTELSSFLAFVLIILSFSCISEKNNPQTSTVEQTVHWENKSGNYNGYRIPSIIITAKGSILAFCEGREAGDAGNIN